LLIDGTYFAGDLCLVVYYDNDNRFTQLYRLTDRERYEEIKEDLENLKRLKMEIASITCDGHSALLKAIKKVFPHIPVQRCIVHIVRQSKIWLTQKPQSIAATELLKLIQQLFSLSTLEQSSYWLLAFYQWNERHHDFIYEKTFHADQIHFWYKHKMLRKTRHLIMRAISNLFYYLEDTSIPSTTNRLESFFGHLKDKLRVHRGLSYSHKKSFIRWYLHFKNL